jgi:Protein of unknown function DUF262
MSNDNVDIENDNVDIESDKQYIKTEILEFIQTLTEPDFIEAIPPGLEIPDQYIFNEAHILDNQWFQEVLLVQDLLGLNNPVVGDTLLGNAYQFVKEIGFDPTSVDKNSENLLEFSIEVLDGIKNRLEKAQELLLKFNDSLVEKKAEEAAAEWADGWEQEDSISSNEPIIATSKTQPIGWFALKAEQRRLELSPSYQRGDVWPTADSQKLIESILLGIPLPSVILLKLNVDGPRYEVVDGKQRLTSILRFIGRHPKALEYVNKLQLEYSEKLEGANLIDIFHSDFPRFRAIHKNLVAPINSKIEKEHYLPFKTSAKSGVRTSEGSFIGGKYFTEILNVHVLAAGSKTRVEDLFRDSAAEYTLPFIEFTEASPKQIHHVFNLYNKQGKHLNAEEIRNAVFHDIDLLKALFTASGDNSRQADDDNGFFLGKNDEIVRNCSSAMAGLFDSPGRYKRTKVLSWISSIFVSDCGTNGTPNTLSTARQIDSVLKAIQDNKSSELRSSEKIKVLITSLTEVVQFVSSRNSDWPTKYKTSSGTNWQELQFVALALGLLLIREQYDGSKKLDEIMDDNKVESLVNLLETKELKRPTKTQTGVQWEYIGFVAITVANLANPNFTQMSKQMRAKYGASPIEVLQTLHNTYSTRPAR